ncbi:hypothetical protein NDU88_001693 [Pleurodeles waltl]|uniref:Uncharacterized protein n=1 Tax=Pleurodeles waltl TaxID=8319 RepID=A0AAV7P7V0_PLEWA|nr:hypothetical protein NDU88_001693 [Pleurodeles waltl]
MRSCSEGFRIPTGLSAKPARDALLGLPGNSARRRLPHSLTEPQRVSSWCALSLSLAQPQSVTGALVAIPA